LLGVRLNGGRQAADSASWWQEESDMQDLAPRPVPVEVRRTKPEQVEFWFTDKKPATAEAVAPVASSTPAAATRGGSPVSVAEPAADVRRARAAWRGQDLFLAARKTSPGCAPAPAGEQNRVLRSSATYSQQGRASSMVDIARYLSLSGALDGGPVTRRSRGASGGSRLKLGSQTGVRRFLNAFILERLPPRDISSHGPPRAGGSLLM